MSNVELETGKSSSVDEPRRFRVWVFGDAHLHGEKGHYKRESLAEPIRQSESPGGFEWDIALNIGDLCGRHPLPDDEEGLEVVRQYGALRQHQREQVYDICGNEDRSGLQQPPAWWFRKWVDPMGESTEFSGVNSRMRPYPTEGTWERYCLRVGNVLFLMMSDINEPSQKVGRGTLGGNPGGVVSCETFQWWKSMVQQNPDSIIITAHHYVLKDTTVASGEWEGMRRTADGGWRGWYHGYHPQGTPMGASYLYWVCSQPDSNAFQQVLAAEPGRVALWLGGHTHTTPDDTYGGKSHIEQRWGTTFMNVANLTQGYTATPLGNLAPRSWVLTLKEGSAEVAANCYLHTDDIAPRGWYPKFDRTIPLPRRFFFECPERQAPMKTRESMASRERRGPVLGREPHRNRPYFACI